uniref:Cytochrome b6/f complex subunit V n=1 Tax=Selaginella remotifolia TaxID=137170 RepID=A0A482CGJ8_SELRE|nr:cytochrome b6/f complex subunit V [Selaginella remotifolia]QBL76280.1 cytochrome b6/f complex subunit V [Selaginella remotifolia]
MVEAPPPGTVPGSTPITPAGPLVTAYPQYRRGDRR